MIDKIETALTKIDGKYITNEKLNYEKIIQFELYHQMRILKVDECELTPEYKKESHYFKENPFSHDIGDYIPDLLMHKLDDKSNQLVAIEIKNLKKNNMAKIYKDIMKLMCYCHKSETSLNYKIGLLIVYGDCFITKLNKARIYKHKIVDLFNYAYNPVEIWLLTNDKVIKKYKKEDIQQLECT